MRYTTSPPPASRRQPAPRLSRSGLVRVHLGVDRPREQRRPDCEQAGGEAQAGLGQREQGEGVQLRWG